MSVVRLIIGFVAGWLSLVPTIALASPGDLLSLFVDSNKRPSDLYLLVSDQAPSVCQPILKSLNAAYEIGEANIDRNPRISVDSDLLLKSDLEVPWKRKLVHEPDAESFETSSLDVAQVQLQGRPLTLTRHIAKKRVAELGASLANDTLWMSVNPLPATLDRGPSPQELARVHAAQIAVDVNDVKSIDAVPNLAVSALRRGPPPPLMLLNVISLKQELYILAIDGVQAEIAAPRSNEGTIDLYVLRLLSEKDLRAVCHFRAS
jgi:hypothetical protein